MSKPVRILKTDIDILRYIEAYRDEYCMSPAYGAIMAHTNKARSTIKHSIDKLIRLGYLTATDHDQSGRIRSGSLVISRSGHRLLKESHNDTLS